MTPLRSVGGEIMKKQLLSCARSTLGLALFVASGAPCFAAPPVSANNSSRERAVPAGKPQPPAKTTSAAVPALPAQVLSEDQKILHALNRLGFGARPAAVANGGRGRGRRRGRGGLYLHRSSGRIRRFFMPSTAWGSARARATLRTCAALVFRRGLHNSFSPPVSTTPSSSKIG